MSYYAKIINGKVIEVIVAEPEFFNTFVDKTPGQWLQTSDPTTNIPLRGNFAGIGYIYDAEKDVFYPPSPFPSWVLNSDYVWQAPVDKPIDGKVYEWDESIKNWVEHNV